MANKGLLDTDDFVKAMRPLLNKAQCQTSVFTFGYGTMHDPDMLSSIAAAGNGMYYRILDPVSCIVHAATSTTEPPATILTPFSSSQEMIAGAFTDCLGGIMSMTASGLLLTVEPLNGATISR